MEDTISVAILGSTGYVGLELINILSRHPNININFIGSNSFKGRKINEFDKRINNNLPLIEPLESFDYTKSKVVFLALPHLISQNYVKKLFNKNYIIDLSADFRLDDKEVFNKNYNSNHTCPEYLKEFIYGLPEINKKTIKKSRYIAIPGCYPTSVLLPLIPLIKNKLIKTNNIIIDTKSGYSGAGKKFDKNNLFFNNLENFYNYNTNQHRHICEIHQELQKYTNEKINFSFNPHILPSFRGMLSTLYCDLLDNINENDAKDCLKNFYSGSDFVYLIDSDEKADFFKVAFTNNCYIKFIKSNDSKKIIIVSLIDNLVKGASGQAVQCMNIIFGLKENTGINEK